MTKGFRREILVSILVIVGSVCAFGIYFWRVSGTLRGSADSVLSLNQTIVDQAQLSQVIVNLKRDESEADRSQARMDAVIPDEEQLLDFRSWTKNQATVHNLSASIEFKDRGKFRGGSDIMFQNASMNFDGTIDNFISFLKELEMGADRFLVGFDTFDVSRSASGYRLGGGAKIFFHGTSTSP